MLKKYFFYKNSLVITKRKIKIFFWVPQRCRTSNSKRWNFLENRLWSFQAASASDPFEACRFPCTHCRRISGFTQLQL